MKTNGVRNWVVAVLSVVALFLMQACNKSDEPQGKGEVEFQITDAPIDDANVKGVFVTVVDIKINGQSISGFTKQTIDIKAYQEGNTKLLATAQLDPGTYNDIVLVLDVDADATATGPGCYVLTTDNIKYKLRSSGKIELKQTTSWTVVSAGKSTLVFDFDLRKAIKSSTDVSIKYQFVSDATLLKSVRLVLKEKTGTISGTYIEQGVGSEKVIVYVYKSGTFNTITEITPYGDDGIFFNNAVASTQVKTSLSGTSYTIALLGEGDYELHFASYKKDVSSDKFVLQSMLKTQTSASGSDLVSVKSGSMVTLTTVVTGIL